MKIAFFASDKIAIPILEHIVSNDLAKIVLVMTKPDRAAKRGLKLMATAIKSRALELGLSVLTEEPTPEILQRYEVARILVFAYGEFITKSVFSALPTINIHPSLLPKYRGPSPLQTALLNGDNQTGVTIFFIDTKMDAGDIIYQEAFDLIDEDDYISLAEKAILHSKKLIDKMLLLDDIALKEISYKQNESEATICELIKKEDSRIYEQETPVKIHNKVRAIGGFIEREGKRIKIIETKLIDNSLYLIKVQLEGKKAVNYKEFIAAYPALNIGEVNGT